VRGSTEERERTGFLEVIGRSRFEGRTERRGERWKPRRGGNQLIAPANADQGKVGNVACGPRRLVLSNAAFCDFEG